MPDRDRRPKPEPKMNEADRAAAGRNATPQEGGVGTTPRVATAREVQRREEQARAEKAQMRETPEVQAAGVGVSAETPENVNRIRAAQGLGGTGDTGEPRTAAEREEAATASAFVGSTTRGTPDTEVAMRAQDDTRQVPQQPETHFQEAQAYFSSALIDAYRTARAAVMQLRAMSTPAESTAFQPPSTFIPAIEALEAGLENFRVEAGIQG